MAAIDQIGGKIIHPFDKARVRQADHSFLQGGSREVDPTSLDRNWKIARGAKTAPRTFNKELETLNHILRYVRDVAGLLLDNPAEKIRSKKAASTAIQIPTKEQFCALLEALRSEPQAVRSRALDFTEFLAYSGLRVAEGTTVTPRDVNFDKPTLTVTGGESCPVVSTPSQTAGKTPCREKAATR